MATQIRAARRNAATQVVEKAIDRVFNEVASLDGNPDGLIGVPELYVAILLVFNDLNKYVPGGHINPPKKKRVLELLKKFDKDENGKLDRAEFAELVRLCLPDLVKRVVTHVLVYCSVVPLLVWATRRSIAEVPHCRRFGEKLPGGLLATVFTLILKVAGVFKN